MADNVDITPGTGATVATDDTGAGGHVQLFKLAIATNGAATLVPADAPNGVLVDVSRVQGSVTLAEPVTVDGTVSVTEPVSIDDNSASLTVDAPLATPVGTRLSDGSSAIGTTSQRLHVEVGCLLRAKRAEPRQARAGGAVGLAEPRERLVGDLQEQFAPGRARPLVEAGSMSMY